MVCPSHSYRYSFIHLGFFPAATLWRSSSGERTPSRGGRGAPLAASAPCPPVATGAPCCCAPPPCVSCSVTREGGTRSVTASSSGRSGGPACPGRSTPRCTLAAGTNPAAYMLCSQSVSLRLGGVVKRWKADAREGSRQAATTERSAEHGSRGPKAASRTRPSAHSTRMSARENSCVVRGSEAVIQGAVSSNHHAPRRASPLQPPAWPVS